MSLDARHAIWEPFGIAILYTLLAPIIRNLVRALQAWASTWGENWNLSITKDGKINISKYLKLRTSYDERTKILEDVISKESEHIENFNKLNTDLLDTKSKMNETAQRLNESEQFINQLQDSRILNGTWECTWVREDGKIGKETVLIDSNRYYIMGPMAEKHHTFDIRNYFYNNRNEDVFFVKEVFDSLKQSRPKSEHYNINRLRFETKDILIGTENGTTQIKYVRN